MGGLFTTNFSFPSSYFGTLNIVSGDQRTIGEYLKNVICALGIERDSVEFLKYRLTKEYLCRYVVLKIVWKIYFFNKNYDWARFFRGGFLTCFWLRNRIQFHWHLIWSWNSFCIDLVGCSREFKIFLDKTLFKIFNKKSNVIAVLWALYWFFKDSKFLNANLENWIFSRKFLKIHLLLKFINFHLLTNYF